MILKKCTILTSVALVLSACGGHTVVEEREEALAAYQVPIFTHQIPKRELGGMLQEYQKAADSQFPVIEALARQRIADIALEESEAKLLQYDLDESADTSNAGYFTAIRIYNALLGSYPDSLQNPRIRYQLARAYDYAGEPLRVLDVLSDLVIQHPQSELYAEAQYRRGELLFTLGKFGAAAAAYQAVTEQGQKKPFYKHALYKHAWALYRADRITASHHHFADLLEYLEVADDIEQVKIGNRELVNDVLRIMAVSFSQQQGTESINAFVKTRGDQVYGALIYQALASQFITQRLYGEAAAVYNYYSDHYVEQGQAPFYHLQAIKLYRKNRMLKQELAARKVFAERYGAQMSIWGIHSEAQYAEIKPELKDNLIFLAKYHHGRYQKSKVLSEAKLAQQWYQQFLNDFPSEVESGEVNFLYAENLYEIGLYAQASAAYEMAAYRYAPYTNAVEAGYAVLISLEKRNDLLAEDFNHQMIAASSQFIQTFPDDSRVNEVHHKRVDQYLALKEFKVAAENLELLIPLISQQHAVLGSLWGKLTYAYFMLDDFPAVEKSAQQALRHLTVKDNKLRGEINERLAAAIYKQGEAAQAMGDFAGAALQFLRIALIVPNAAIIAQAEYDGATAHINDSNWPAAATVLERFITKNPQHKLVNGAKEKVAFVYSEMGDSTKAAQAYRELAKIEKNPERKRAWVSQSADFYQQSGDFKLSAKMLTQLMALMPIHNSEYFEIAFRIAKIDFESGNMSGYKSKLNLIINDVGSDNDQAVLRQHAAMATLALAEEQYKAFAVIKLVHPIKTAMKHKKETMKLALNLYKRVSKYKISNTTTAATYYIGEIYLQFSQSLLSSEMPKELDGEELEMYTMMLEEQAFPFEEKSINLHQLNTKRVSSGIYDQWVKKSYKSLEKLQPARFYKHETTEAIITSLN